MRWRHDVGAFAIVRSLTAPCSHERFQDSLLHDDAILVDQLPSPNDAASATARVVHFRDFCHHRYRVTDVDGFEKSPLSNFRKRDVAHPGTSAAQSGEKG